MRRRRADLRAAVAVALLGGVFVASALPVAPIPVARVAASPVDEQERRVEQISDQLDRLESRFEQLGAQLADAEAAKADLDEQIAAASVRVADLERQLGTLDVQLAEMAIDSFVAGGATSVSPLFADVASITDGLAAEQLTRIALDIGDADVDEFDALLTDLERERASLQRKQEEAAAYAEQIAAAQSEAEQLHTEYEQRYEEAQAELGELLAEEERRRAEEEYARQQAQARAEQERAREEAERARQAAASSGPSRGGSGPATTAPPSDDPGPSDAGSSGGGSVPVSGNAGVAVNAAMGQLGVPYRFAASEPGVAFDCSGLTKYAWGRAGVSLPHQSAQQYAVTRHVPKEDAQPGDLIFYRSPIGHVAIYVGGGQMVHAPRTGDVVKVAAVDWGRVVGVSRPG